MSIEHFFKCFGDTEATISSATVNRVTAFRSDGYELNDEALSTPGQTEFIILDAQILHEIKPVFVVVTRDADQYAWYATGILGNAGRLAWYTAPLLGESDQNLLQVAVREWFRKISGSDGYLAAQLTRLVSNTGSRLLGGTGRILADDRRHAHGEGFQSNLAFKPCGFLSG